METIKNPRIMKYGFRFRSASRYRTAVFWCEKKFGYKDKMKKWNCRSHFYHTPGKQFGYGAIYLSDLDDALEFKLIWS